MNMIRKAGLALSLTLSLASLLFYQFSGLYFFLVERGEPYPVSQLRSQGCDENSLIGLGFIIFLLLAAFNLWRYKEPLSRRDVLVHLLILLFQGGGLLLIEVGSFTYSLRASSGWYLMIWLILYAACGLC